MQSGIKFSSETRLLIFPEFFLNILWYVVLQSYAAFLEPCYKRNTNLHPCVLHPVGELLL